MNQVMATPSASTDGYSRSTAFLVTWLRDLEECRQGGLLSDEDYALQRAEKLAELLCEHRHLWIAPIVAAGSVGSIGASVAWMCSMNWQLAGVGASLGALFGIVMLARPCRENLKEKQIRERLESLNALLAMDLISADEFLVYEERLHSGGRELQLVANFR